MQLLLDTHAALWWAIDPSVLSPAARQAVDDPGNVLWFSSASTWELAIKVRAGKLALDVPGFVDRLADAGVRLLGIGNDDAVGAGLLEWAHRDPFDRMLVAQAERLGLVLITRDRTVLARTAASAVEA